VLENRVVRIFGLEKRGNNRRIGKKLQKELHNLYSSINIINVIKSRTIVSVGHMTCKKDRRNA
jgi:hypothetical protein